MEKATTKLPAAEPQSAEKGVTVYQVAGQEVKLSYAIVRNFLTRGNGKVSDAEIVQFISLCRFNQLNPFLGEAYLVKYSDSTPAQLVSSKESFMKRAESSNHYQGYRAGVIVLRDNQAIELEGAFLLPTDKLVGGWAEVYRDDRKFPIVARVSFAEYNKGQSTWNEKPATMIRKVAEAQAFREAFPVQLGAMYTPEEGTESDDQGAGLPAAAAVEEQMAENGNKQALTFGAPAAQEAQPAQAGTQEPEPQPAPAPRPAVQPARAMASREAGATLNFTEPGF